MDTSQPPQVVEPKNSPGDGPDDDPPRRSENKRKRFHPFRVVRNIFSRKAKRQGSDEVQGSSKKSRSTSELSRETPEAPQFPGLAPPYAVGLSVSHDSIFTPEHGNSTDDIQGSSLSIQHMGLKGFQDELFTRVRARRDSDDDDVGLPHSPCTSPTTADVLAQGLKDKSSKSRSTCSASSLLSMGSSENDEDSMGPSRFSYTDRRVSDLDSELDAGQLAPLNHNAALHKIAVRPKRTHGLPHHRKLQQLAASAARVTLPATPEATEDAGKLSSASSYVPDQEEATAVETEKAEVDMQDNDVFISGETEEDAATIPVVEMLKVSEIPSIEDEMLSLPSEREIHVSKGKSAAAELKLRHEIKEFSKRQNEKREAITMDTSSPKQENDESLEVVDVKDSIKSLESTVSVGGGDVQGPKSADTEPSENVQDRQTDNSESWCIIELGQNQEPLESPQVVDLDVNKTKDDEQVQKTVINVNEVTVVTGDSSHFSKTWSKDAEMSPVELYSKEKVNQSEHFPNETSQEKHSKSVASVMQNVSATEDPADDKIPTTLVVHEIPLSEPILQPNSSEGTEKQKSIPVDKDQHSGSLVLAPVDSKADQRPVVEMPRVVLRRHTSNRTVPQMPEVQKDFRASADMVSSPNFSDIMKHRRSLVDSETTVEGIKGFSRSVSEENSKNSPLNSGNRVSVEIIPFSQRNKNPSYLSTSPSKTSELQTSERDETVENLNSIDDSEVATPQKPDRMQYPIRFRIRKGSRSFSEVKESTSNRGGDELENRFSDIKPHLRPKPQIPIKDESTGSSTPEFMRIQLRSSKEELDKPEPLASPQVTPQWEVKILQRQRSGPSSLPVMPQSVESKKPTDFKTPEVNGNNEKPWLEKKESDSKILAQPLAVDNINNVTELPKKEDIKLKDNNNLPAERITSSNVASSDGTAKVPGSPKSTTTHEPELFRVFARRSIKQKHSDKSSETIATTPEKDEVTEKANQGDKTPKAVESNNVQNTKPLPSPQKIETKLTETPKKQELKVNISEMSRKLDSTPKCISKEPVRKADSLDTKTASEQYAKKNEMANRATPITKKADSSVVEERKQTPVWNRNANVKSWVNSEPKHNQVESPVHRRNSAPPEPKIAEKENVLAREQNQMIVSIQPQRPTIPLTRNDSSSKLMINSNTDAGTPSWMQLAQQRREQREQKERMLYASTGSSNFVLEPNSRPSRNSKVLDMVNNFQKLQTT